LLRQLRHVGEELLELARRRHAREHVGGRAPDVAVGVARAGRDEHVVGLDPLAADEELDLAAQHLEVLLHRGMRVGRDAAAGIDPRLDDQHVALVTELVALLEDGVLD